MAKTLKDKVQKARFNASPGEVAIAAGQTVYRNAKTAKVNLDMGEEEKAKKILTPRMTQDRNKTLARGVAIEKREAKKAAAKRAAAAIGNSPATKKKESMAKPTTKKVSVGKPMAKPATKTSSKTTTKAPAKTPMPKTTKKPEKMTPQDAAMKKILEKKYGKIYG